MRACTVGTGTRNARAISSLDRPPTTRRVSATRASRESTGWQLTNISARTSSSILSGSIFRRRPPGRPPAGRTGPAGRSGGGSRRSPAAGPWPSASRPDWPERRSGHDTSASATASWAASSASPKSPVNRVSAATIRADSIRQTASTSAVPIRSGRCSRAGPFLDELSLSCGTSSSPGTRRISILDPGTAGTRLAHSTASCFEATSSRKKPPNSSLVSPYGPSVTTGASPLKSTTTPWPGSSSPSAATKTPALTISSMNRRVAGHHLVDRRPSWPRSTHRCPA